jgi:hypothetical protein
MGLHSILPKGVLDNDDIARAIWSDYQKKLSDLDPHRALLRCRGKPRCSLMESIETSSSRNSNSACGGSSNHSTSSTTISSVRSKTNVSGNDRAVRMLGRGGTSVVKSLSMVEETDYIYSPPTTTSTACDSEYPSTPNTTTTTLDLHSASNSSSTLHFGHTLEKNVDVWR